MGKAGLQLRTSGSTSLVYIFFTLILSFLQTLWPLANNWSLTVLSHRPLSKLNSQPNRRGRAKAGRRDHHQPPAQTSRVQDSGECPICTGKLLGPGGCYGTAKHHLRAD